VQLFTKSCEEKSDKKVQLFTKSCEEKGNKKKQNIKTKRTNGEFD
jgi:hypothetical protein